jgi:hypothetical protein
MSLIEMFSAESKMIEPVQKAIQDYLTTRLKFNVTAKAPAVRKGEEFKINSLCLLRMNRKENVAPVVVGFAKEDSQKIFHDLITKAAIPDFEPKNAENEILKALYTVMDTELQKKGKGLDPKTAVTLTSKNLGAWSTVSAMSSVQFPFTVQGVELVFEIPHLTEEYAKQRKNLNSLF